MDIGLIIRNINTSTDLFDSSLGNQDYNATFTLGQVLRIMDRSTPTSTPACSSLERVALNLTVGFFALAVLGISLVFVFKLEKVDVKLLSLIFISVLMGAIFVGEIASIVLSYCG